MLGMYLRLHTMLLTLTVPGGKMLRNDTIVNYGLTLNEACWNTYASTALVDFFVLVILVSDGPFSTGIGPEAFAYISSDGNFTGGSPPTPAQLAFYSLHGFYITSSVYILRPEVLESNFYAWRVTGDQKYLDRAASAIDSFNKFLPATVAFAPIDDVNDEDSTKIDDMESFWFAEVLKYMFVVFSLCDLGLKCSPKISDIRRSSECQSG